MNKPAKNITYDRVLKMKDSMKDLTPKVSGTYKRKVKNKRKFKIDITKKMRGL